MTMNEWLSPPPETCDICNDPIEDFFVDGKMALGSWAAMCPDCHERIGYGFGIGFGQLYWRVGDRWIAIAGGSVQERRKR